MAKSHYNPDSGHDLSLSVSMTAAYVPLRDAAWPAAKKTDRALHGLPGVAPAAMKAAPSIIIMPNN
jgi:hypothetical protein